jgi:acyl-coenzyme A thioesterase PaaI-like protein
MVLLSRIGPEALAVTSNLNVDFMRRPRPADLVADGTILKLGRSLAVMDVVLRSRNEDGSLTKPVARATVTYSLALLDRSGQDGTAGTDEGTR